MQVYCKGVPGCHCVRVKNTCVGAKAGPVITYDDERESVGCEWNMVLGGWQGVEGRGEIKGLRLHVPERENLLDIFLHRSFFFFFLFPLRRVRFSCSLFTFPPLFFFLFLFSTVLDLLTGNTFDWESFPFFFSFFFVPLLSLPSAGSFYAERKY